MKIPKSVINSTIQNVLTVERIHEYSNLFGDFIAEYVPEVSDSKKEITKVVASILKVAQMGKLDELQHFAETKLSTVNISSKDYSYNPILIQDIINCK